MSNIELSPKYGVNPTIPICFWCGEEMSEIALMGRVRERDPHTGRAVRDSDVEISLSHHICLGYEPCDHCKEAFKQGVLIIECTHSPKDSRPAISKDEDGDDVYPTHRFMLVKGDAARRYFSNPEFKAGDKFLVSEELFNYIKPIDNN